ncbi:LOW QUALITY PROTEIN: hypothetical protein ACHAWF_004944 [Thalassiosira exigua]
MGPASLSTEKPVSTPSSSRGSSQRTSNGTSSGGSSSPGHTLNSTTLLPHFFSGSYSAPPFTNGSVHKSEGRGTAWRSRPSNRSSRPGTAGTVTSPTSPASSSPDDRPQQITSRAPPGEDARGSPDFAPNFQVEDVPVDRISVLMPLMDSRRISRAHLGVAVVVRRHLSIDLLRQILVDVGVGLDVPPLLSCPVLHVLPPRNPAFDALPFRRRRRAIDLRQDGVQGALDDVPPAPALGQGADEAPVAQSRRRRPFVQRLPRFLGGEDVVPDRGLLPRTRPRRTSCGPLVRKRNRPGATRRRRRRGEGDGRRGRERQEEGEVHRSVSLFAMQ